MTHDEIMTVLKCEYAALKRNKKHIVFDPNNNAYFILVATGKIQKPYPGLEEIKAAAKRLHTKDLRAELERASNNQTVVVERWIKDFYNVLEGKPKMKKKYYNFVMRLILQDYLEKCIDNDLEFKDIV